MKKFQKKKKNAKTFRRDQDSNLRPFGQNVINNDSIAQWQMLHCSKFFSFLYAKFLQNRKKVFLGGDRLCVMPNPDNPSLTLIQGKMCIETKIG